MHFREHFLPGLIATTISVCLLSCHHNSLAARGSEESKTSARLDASDRPELSLPTGLWRSVFFEMSETDETPETLDANDSVPSNGRPSAVRHPKQELAAVRLDHEFMDFTGMSSEPTFDRPIGEPLSCEALSDWERAACLAAGPSGKWSTREGPSVISMIVGIVGLAIVIGAYFNSGR